MADDSVNEKLPPHNEADIISSSSATDNNSTFDVEDIVDHRVGSTGTFEYYVKWQGFPSTSNTWEPAYNFISAETIREYHEKREIKRMEKKGKRRKSVTSNDSKHSVDRANMNESDEMAYIPEKVLNILQNERGDLITLIKFRARSEAKFVPAEWANFRCPELVIEFYESRIYWNIDGKQLTKHLKSEMKSEDTN